MKPLRQYLKHQRMSQVELARSLNVSQPTVWAWLHGTKRPTPDNLVRLADLTGLTVDDLLERRRA